MTDLLLSTPTVEQMLRVEQSTLSGWHSDGRLIPNNISARPFLYAIETIEAFLKSCALNFGTYKRTTARALYTQVERLLTTDEVAEQLGLSHQGVSWRVHNGLLPVFVLSSKALRYPASIVAKEGRNADTIDKYLAAKILGAQPSTVVTLVRNGRLKAVRKAGYGTALFITRASFLEYLTERLAETGMPAHVWWEDRLHYPEPLITPDQIFPQLRMSKEGVVELIEAGRLPCIRTPGGFRLVPPRYVAAIAAERLPFSPAQIAKLFAVGEARAAKWIAGRALCSAQHDRSNMFCPRRACLLAYIERRRINDTLDPNDWLTSVLREGGIATVSLDEFTDLTFDDVREGVEAGWLSGVWLPHKHDSFVEIATTTSVAFSLRRLARRRDRRAGGTTPYLRYDEFLK